MGGEVRLKIGKRAWRKNARVSPHEGQARFFKDPWKNVTIVRLIRCVDARAMGRYSMWLVEDTVTGKEEEVLARYFGDVLTEMEVVAWAVGGTDRRD